MSFADLSEPFISHSWFLFELKLDYTTIDVVILSRYHFSSHLFNLEREFFFFFLVEKGVDRVCD